jgi:hypothetical protein
MATCAPVICLRAMSNWPKPYDTGERYFSVEGPFESDGTAVQVGARDN